MSRGRPSSLVRGGAVLALLVVLGACTPGGQFDPTELVSGNMFSSKKKLAGEREPLFPQGVPGAETGVPPDLIKGYQPPPEPVAAADSEAATKAAATAEKPKPKPKPRRKVARAPAPRAHDPIWDKKASAPPAAAQSAQSPWPAPPPSGQSVQTNWPSPPGAQSQAAPSVQTNWPAPPPTRQTQ